MLKFKWIPNKTMISRDELVSKLQVMGIPVTKGYGRMMHENPLFTRKIAYKHGCPFSCQHILNKNIVYGKGTLPISEKINEQFIWFKYINPPNTIKDMDDIIKAFNIIFEG